MNTAANVIPMNPANDDLVFARAFHVLRALDIVRKKMTVAAKSASADWSAKLTECTQGYRAPLREQFDGIDKMSQKHAKELLIQVATGVHDRDQIDADKKTDMTERKGKIAKIDAAINEVVSSASAGSTEQIDMFGAGTQSELVAGLPWATKGTKEAIYSALLYLSDAGTLDVHQQQLLTDIASAGLEPINLGLDAAQAIEADTSVESEDDEDTEGEDDVGFFDE